MGLRLTQDFQAGQDLDGLLVVNPSRNDPPSLLSDQVPVLGLAQTQDNLARYSYIQRGECYRKTLRGPHEWRVRKEGVVVSPSMPEVRPQASAIPDPKSCGQRPFELTLLDSPSLPVSLIRQAGGLLRERREPRHPQNQPEARLPLSDQTPWYRDLPVQLRALLTTPQPAPARFSSRPADVRDLWQDYLPNPYSWANSLLVHLFVLTVLVFPFALQHLIHPVPLPKKMFNLTPLVLPFQLHGNADRTGGGGGGGNHSPLPAPRGALPRFARTQFTPPTVIVPKVAPLLPMPATLIGPPQLILPAMKWDMPFGDPAAAVGPPSPGPGTGGGIGNGNGTGVAQGDGPGAGPGEGGGCCGGRFQVGVDGVGEPIPIYSPDPSYSEEARKAKFGGNVLLWIVVNAQGLVENVRVAKPLGMSLDEEAVKTVSTWRFKPALRQGVPVPVQVQVEVSFRLF